MTTQPLSDERIAEITNRVNAAIKGPWRWNLNLKSKHIYLEAMISGFEYVMDFRRWGMSGAKPRFLHKRLMTDAEEFKAIVPGREHHADWFQTINHPDANFIAHSRADVPDLLAEIARLKAELKRKDDALLAEAEEIMKLYLSNYPQDRDGMDGNGPLPVGVKRARAFLAKVEAAK